MQIVPEDIVGVRVLEDTLIAVARPEEEGDGGAFGNDLAVHLDLAGGAPPLAMHDRVVAHHLGEDVGPEGVVALDLLKLIGTGVEHVVPHVGDGLVGGIAAGGEEEGDEALDLLDVHALALEFGGDDAGNEILAGVLRALPDDGVEVVPDLVAGVDAVDVILAGAHAGDEALVPVHEGVFIGAVQAEHVGDDAHGELVGELLDELDLAGIGEALGDVVGGLLDDRAEELASDRLDVGQERLEAVADELVGDDVAHPAVPLAVAVLEDVGAEDGALAELVGAVGLVEGAVVVLVVLEDVDDVLVAAEHPAAMEPIAEEGAVVAQALVEGEGVLAVFGGIELARVDLGLEALSRRLSCRHAWTPREPEGSL